MAKVRFLGSVPVTVPELGQQEIQPDELVTVPDDRFGGYVCQTGTWESVEEPADWKWPEDQAEDDSAPAEPAAEQAVPASQTRERAVPARKTKARGDV